MGYNISMYIGAHVSIAGGVVNAPGNAADEGCECFQMFTRSPRGGKAPVIDDTVARAFKEQSATYKQKNCYIHTPYYINLASSNNRIRHGSITVIREELERGSRLGATALMTHLGSSKDLGKKQAMAKVIQGLDKALHGYEGETVFMIENSAGAGGTIIGDTFEEIGSIIKALKQYTMGVCLDTCHAFVSGYDLRTPAVVKKTLAEFNKQIGLEKLIMIHANDAKTEFGSHKDRHEHIGQGTIGQIGFKSLLRHPKLRKVDFILETKSDGQREEDIKLLKRLRNDT